MSYVICEEWSTQFRDADQDGLLGLRGYMNYFQELVGKYQLSLGIGVNRIYPRYGLVWLYSKFRARVFEKVPYGEKVEMKVWAEPLRSSVRLTPVLEIRYEGRLAFQGRLEACLANLETGAIARISDIEMGEDAFGPALEELPGFTRLPRQLPQGEKAWEYRVGYSDLDINHHMNNQRYIPLFMDAFDSAFWKEHPVRELEIHYLNQSYEGETLTVLGQQEEKGSRLVALKEDGTPAANAWLGWE